MKLVTRLLCVAFISLTPVGCGFALVHGPATREAANSEFTCSNSNVGPGLDVAAAASGVGLLVLAAASQGADDYFYYVSDEFAVLGSMVAVLYSISAYVGFRKTARCREATAQLSNPRSALAGGNSVSSIFALPRGEPKQRTALDGSGGDPLRSRSW